MPSAVLHRDMVIAAPVPDAIMDLLGFIAVRVDRHTKASGKRKGEGLGR